MDIGKRMMEKWGWAKVQGSKRALRSLKAKGQGLGKDNSGMTSCLVLRKDTGSSTQGRIESLALRVAPLPLSLRRGRRADVVEGFEGCEELSSSSKLLFCPRQPASPLLHCSVLAF